jgi:hypothetical protein
MGLSAYDLKQADYQDFCNEFIDTYKAMTVNGADSALRPYTRTNYDPIRDAMYEVFEEIMEKIPQPALEAFLAAHQIKLDPVDEVLENIAARAYGERYDH